jgi:hypothetical protein
MAIYILAALVLAYALAMWWFWWRPAEHVGFHQHRTSTQSGHWQRRAMSSRQPNPY